MTKKKILITSMLMCIVTLVSSAQSKADLFVEYDYTHPDNRGIIKNDKMSLLASSEKSKFFNETSLWADSLRSTPGGEARYHEILNKACNVIRPDGSVATDLTRGPSKVIYTYIFTELGKETVTVYDNYGLEDTSHYTEPIDEIQWNITMDSVKNVLGYDCILAETDYHGRHWKAWFTSELPLPFGPWKLRGLPGIILAAETNSGFNFKATALGPTDRIMSTMYFADKYPQKNRKKAQKDFDTFINNVQAIYNTQSGGRVQVVWEDENGNPIEPIKYKAETHCIETDYNK